MPPAKAITQAYYNIQKGAASVERISYVLQEPEVIVQKPDALRKRIFTIRSSTGMLVSGMKKKMS